MDLTLPAKPAVDKNRDMAGQIHALSIVIQNHRSRELTVASRISELEDSLARELSNKRQTLNVT